VFEAIFYQSTLNNAQRRIISSYLSAKWDRPLNAAADYQDVYQGDDPGNGNYDYFVGGIGHDSGTQSVGTSQGLTISDTNFLTTDNKFILAGVDYLLTTPTTGTTTSDLLSAYINRSNRTWYIDKTGSGGTVNLMFDAAEIGIPVHNGKHYGLLHRSNSSGLFTEAARAVMVTGQLTFSHLPIDGVYAVGKVNNEIDLSIVKKASDETPNVGDSVTFTLIVSNSGPAVANDATVVDTLPSGFGNPTLTSNPAGTSFSIVGSTIYWTGISVPVGGSVSAVFTADVLPP